MVSDSDIERVLLSAAEIERRVAEMASEIALCFEGQEVTALGILNGAFVFLSDLLRALPCPTRVGFLHASSYGDGTRPGELAVETVGPLDLADRDVLIVEDILDTGRSLKRITEVVSEAGPSSLRVAVLLDKTDRREVPAQADHIGFTVPDEFLVGYGLDYAGRYRHLPYVGVLSRAVYEGEA
jgi:hypoxanthine phosphoribosyltransferase